jgi:predicted small lipoprotein YifL
MHCWPRYVFIIVVASLGVLSMVGACGRKGPLYIPEPASPPAAGSDVPKPASAGAQPVTEQKQP